MKSERANDESLVLRQVRQKKEMGEGQHMKREAQTSLKLDAMPGSMKNGTDEGLEVGRVLSLMASFCYINVCVRGRRELRMMHYAGLKYSLGQTESLTLG
jgi:hypothetical protein